MIATFGGAASVPSTLSCAATEPRSVETRFGVVNCRPDTRGSHCQYRVPEWAVGADGRLRAGALAVAVDHILGEVSFLRCPRGYWPLTTELTLDFVGGAFPPASVLQLDGWPLRLESQSGLIQGTANFGTASPVVVATSRTANVRVRPAPEPADPVIGTVEAENPKATLEDRLGITYGASQQGMTARLDNPGLWTNEFGILHGGVWACLSEAVASRAVASTTCELSTSHLRTSYLRPGLPANGVNVTATVEHTGRRFSVVSVRGHADDGTLCTVSSVTYRSVEPPLE
jgi:uncharacterized protein (TIGR00369 family)